MRTSEQTDDARLERSSGGNRCVGSELMSVVNGYYSVAHVPPVTSKRGMNH